jgi:hypothetical protein
MNAVRRWLIYRRLLNELTAVPSSALAELGTCRTALCDFAWHCAGREIESRTIVLAPQRTRLRATGKSARR